MLLKGVFWGCLLGFILNWNMALAADLYVESSGSCGGESPCYSTIQAAINAANSGDTIKLAQGIYAETFVLNSGKQLITQGGWDAGFKKQTPRTTSIRAPLVPNGAIAFQELRVMEIAGPMGNATIADVLNGKTFSSDAGTGLTGTMTNNGGGNTITPGTSNHTVAPGYWSSANTVLGDAYLAAGNIKDGVTIFGVTGTFPSDGTAVAGDVKTGSTFYTTSDTKLIGNGTKELSAASNTVAAGYYEETTLSAVDKDLASDNIMSGKVIFGFTGDSNVVNTSSGDAVTGDILSGKKAWVGGVEVTGSAQSVTDRYLDHGNGTVRDQETGLMWTQNANLAGKMTWQAAVDYCEAMNAGAGTYGYTDWRLPSVQEQDGSGGPMGKPELDTLGRPGGIPGATPYTIPSAPFTGVQSGYYWSSTTYAYFTTNAWGVYLNNGYVIIDHKAVANYVWPVRGGQ